ncbi:MULTISPECIES: hypothetical protein [Priestia]|uniref:hypothetical protein n=1 Tax=Priestia TaxID=2800373 RepID=UPI000BF78D87|nr:hypothetical protein [Priestia aryabhattai]MBK0005019.1 hypothetical protein [Bacillus sp. S35]PFW71933.1 hypothetical protein COL23_27225 [Priestia aryabhattai]
MRFLIEYKDFKTKEETNFSLQLLDTFLNEHLIGEFHGSTFECMLIRFINNPSSKKKYKLRVLYEDIAEIELPGNFINNKTLNVEDFLTGLHRVEEAIMLVKTIELKSELDFSEDKLLLKFQQSIKNAPRTLEELKAYFKKQKQTVQSNWAKLADLSMKRSLSNPKPLTKPLITISISAPIEETEPNHSFIYTEVFSNLLRKAEVMLPGYSHIFIHLADILVEAKQEFAPNHRIKDAFSIIDTKKYMASDNETKSNMMFSSIVSALRSITKFDHLEEHKIESVIRKIKEEGTDIELTYFSKQNDKYLAEVIYAVPKSHLTNAPFKLRVTDLNSNVVKTIKIDDINLFWCPYSFGSINIKKDSVVIKGRKSQRAEISRRADKLPDEYIFKIKDIFI